MKKHLIKSAAFLLLLILAVFIPFINVTAATDDAVTLTIIHINDRHGRMDADSYISQLAKETAGNVLILDAGDALHGQTTAILSKGAAMVELMNAVGYSAMVTGNHEFNYGMERLIELSEMMDFPLLAANIKTSDGKTLFQPYAIFPMEGIKVGVFGLATPETVRASDPRNTTELTFEDPSAAAKEMVEALKSEGCDIIIALMHMGIEEASDSANRSDTLALIPGIDVIIDGHSHTKLDNGLLVGNTLIAQTGEHGQNIGVIEITISDGIVSKTARLIEVNNALIADEQILAKIIELNAANETLTGLIVGYTPEFLNGERNQVRTGETNLTNLITDSMRHTTGADIAFLNSGGIRASIPEGDITMGHVLNTLPFSNILITMEITGADLLKILEHGISLYPEPVGQHIQVSGIHFEFDPDAEQGGKVTSITMADSGAFDISKTYTVVTIEFIAAGGDGYETIINRQNLIYYGSDAEAFADYLKTNPVIKSEAENRVRVFSY